MVLEEPSHHTKRIRAPSHSLQICLAFMKTAFSAIQQQSVMLTTVGVKWLLGHCSECCRIISLSESTVGGPFPLLFTDFHQSNIFVDDDWNITCVLDLEWVCALPPEMLAVPYWLTGLCLNELVGENLHEFNQVEQDFMKIFEEEEVKIAAMPSHDTSGCVLSSVMHRSWESDAVWFWRSISSTHATMSLLRDHICPRFARLSLDTEEVLCQYWCQGSDGVVEKKVNDYDMYEKELEALFSK